MPLCTRLRGRSGAADPDPGGRRAQVCYRNALHCSYPNASPRLRVTLNFGFHKRAFVVPRYGEEQVDARRRVLSVAMDCRAKRFPVARPLLPPPPPDVPGAPCSRAAVRPRHSHRPLQLRGSGRLGPGRASDPLRSAARRPPRYPGTAGTAPPARSWHRSASRSERRRRATSCGRVAAAEVPADHGIETATRRRRRGGGSRAQLRVLS
jgi:hypothetical protein